MLLLPSMAAPLVLLMTRTCRSTMLSAYVPAAVALNVMRASPVVGLGYTLSSVPIAVSIDVSSATISNERQSARLTANVLAVVLIPQALLALTETEPATVPQFTTILPVPWPEVIVAPVGTVQV